MKRYILGALPRFLPLSLTNGVLSAAPTAIFGDCKLCRGEVGALGPPTGRKWIAKIFVCILAVGGLTAAQAQIIYPGGSYNQDFNGMGATGTTTPTGWFVGSGTGPAVTGTTVVADNGSNTTPGNYNYGVAGINPVGERALGSKDDSGAQLDTEVHFINSTAFAITQFTLSFDGEQWRNGGSGNPNTSTLQLSTNGITWTNLGLAFNFTSPINTLAAGALDGNAAANRVASIGGTFTLGTPIGIGSAFYFRFADADEPGKDSGIAIDNFSFRAVPEPSAYMLLGVGLLLCGQRFVRRIPAFKPGHASHRNMSSSKNMQSRILSRLALFAVLLLVPHMAKASLYQIDDGISEDSVGVTGTPNDFIALNQFNVINGQDMIGTVEIAWGTPSFPDPSINGLSYTVAIWADPNGDGDPSDAFLLGTAPGVISNANTDTFDITAFSTCIRVTPSFFVGFVITTDGTKFPVGFDESNPLPGRSFVAGNGPNMGDLANLTNNTLVPLGSVESYGLPGNFMIRADACVPEPSTLALLAIGGIGTLVAGARRGSGQTK